MKNTVAALAAGLLLAGCATNPNNVAPTYVSPILYQNLTCEQLAQEAASVSARASAAAGQQADAASRDAVAATVSAIIFWPALFMIGGDGQQTAELARLRGEMQAIEQANTAKGCGIQFAPVEG